MININTFNQLKSELEKVGKVVVCQNATNCDYGQFLVLGNSSKPELEEKICEIVCAWLFDNKEELDGFTFSTNWNETLINCWYQYSLTIEKH